MKKILVLLALLTFFQSYGSIIIKPLVPGAKYFYKHKRLIHNGKHRWVATFNLYIDLLKNYPNKEKPKLLFTAIKRDKIEGHGSSDKGGSVYVMHILVKFNGYYFDPVLNTISTKYSSIYESINELQMKGLVKGLK